MPSRFEPCGLNQMYSLRYGTIPIVNGVGGLVDTVRDVRNQQATGFVLNRLSVQALTAAFKKACDIHGSVKSFAILKRGMKAEYGWGNSSNQYLKCYQ
jgi:starch synthase